MLRLPEKALSAETGKALAALQALVDAGPDFKSRRDLAKSWWKKKTGTKARARAFGEIRKVLAEISFGSVRCAYCQDSAADEIEHMAPKDIRPSLTFQWQNYCFACGPCNGPKGNLFAEVGAGGAISEGHPDQLAVEPGGTAALIDPRREDPTVFFELDIGGVTAGGLILTATSEVLVREGLDPVSAARARWTRDVLKLNREVVRKARETSYQSYRAALTEYAQARSAGEPQTVLDSLRDGILAMPHPTVLNEMIRQATTQPIVSRAIATAPEIATWMR